MHLPIWLTDCKWPVMYLTTEMVLLKWLFDAPVRLNTCTRSQFVIEPIEMIHH